MKLVINKLNFHRKYWINFFQPYLFNLATRVFSNIKEKLFHNSTPGYGSVAQNSLVSSTTILLGIQKIANWGKFSISSKEMADTRKAQISIRQWNKNLGRYMKAKDSDITKYHRLLFCLRSTKRSLFKMEKRGSLSIKFTTKLVSLKIYSCVNFERLNVPWRVINRIVFVSGWKLQTDRQQQGDKKYIRCLRFC